MKTLILALVLGATFVSSSYSEDKKHTYKPPGGYVPDEKTAIAIALAVWNPIYGEDQIKKEKPYKAELKDGVWYVRGSLPPSINIVGGVAEAEISQDDARIIRVSHGK